MPFGSPDGDLSYSTPEAVVRAGFTGDRALLDEALGDPDPHVRTLALGGLARMGALTSTHLETAVTDGDRDVRCRAIVLAIDDVDVDLTPLLDDDDDLVVETTAFAIGERGDAPESVVRRLATIAVDHEISICREAAVAALGALGDPLGLPAVLAATEDRAPVRRRAVIALAPFSGPEVDAALDRALSDRDRQVRQAAEDQLGT